MFEDLFYENDNFLKYCFYKIIRDTQLFLHNYCITFEFILVNQNEFKSNTIIMLISVQQILCKKKIYISAKHTIFYTIVQILLCFYICLRLM